MGQIRMTDIRRLLFSFGLIIVLFIGAGALTLYGLFALGNFTETIYRHPLVVSNAALHAAMHITKMHRDMKDVVLSRNADEWRAALERVGVTERAVYRELNVVRDNILGDEGKKLARQTRALVDEWRPIRGEVVRLMELGETRRAVHITQNRGARHVMTLEEKMLELTIYAREKATGFLQTAQEHRARLEQMTILITVAAVIFSVIIAVVATRRMRQVNSALTRANADLSAERNRLEKALAEIKTLRGIIPVCSNCRQIRDDEGVWKALETYLDAYPEAIVSHGLCPICLKELYPEFADVVNAGLAAESAERSLGEDRKVDSGADGPHRN